MDGAFDEAVKPSLPSQPQSQRHSKNHRQTKRGGNAQERGPEITQQPVGRQQLACRYEDLAWRR